MLPDEVDVGADLGDAVVPVGFVFDGDMAVEVLTLEFLEAGGDVDDALAGDDNGDVAESGLVLHCPSGGR